MINETNVLRKNFIQRRLSILPGSSLQCWQTASCKLNMSGAQRRKLMVRANVCVSCQSSGLFYHGPCSLDRQTEQTKPMSIILRWQKQAALRSTCSCTGKLMCLRVARPGKKEVWKSMLSVASVSFTTTGKMSREHTIKYCRSPEGLSSLR